MAAPKCNAVVTELTVVNSDSMIIRIAPEGWVLPEYTPGQFAVLGLPAGSARIQLSDPEDEPNNPNKMIRRAYSVASSPLEADYLEFYITLVRSGALTPRLFALERGDKIYVTPKITGLFTLERTPRDADIVMISTGTGLAPYMSMVRTCLKPGATRRFTLIHGARHSWDLGYRSELSTLDRHAENFTYHPVISRPDEEIVPWAGTSGYVQDVWNSGKAWANWPAAPTPENSNIFLCGNPAMIESVVDLVSKEGFIEHTAKQPGTLHFERYW